MIKRINDNEVHRMKSYGNDDSYLYIVKADDELHIEIISQYGEKSFIFNKEVLDYLTSLLNQSQRH